LLLLRLDRGVSAKAGLSACVASSATPAAGAAGASSSGMVSGAASGRLPEDSPVTACGGAPCSYTMGLCRCFRGGDPRILTGMQLPPDGARGSVARAAATGCSSGASSPRLLLAGADLTGVASSDFRHAGALASKAAGDELWRAGVSSFTAAVSGSGEDDRRGSGLSGPGGAFRRDGEAPLLPTMLAAAWAPPIDGGILGEAMVKAVEEGSSLSMVDTSTSTEGLLGDLPATTAAAAAGERGEATSRLATKAAQGDASAVLAAAVAASS